MKYKLKDICSYRNEKIYISEFDKNKYVSTDNMLPNFGGVGELKTIPNNCKVNKYFINDVLLSNIRPYFKKMMLAEENGGCSSDVLVLKMDVEKVNPKYLYYRLMVDDFFKYVVATSRGTKMPRGDKEAIMNYELNLPLLKEQKKIVSIFEQISKKIELNNKINNNLYNYISSYLNSLYEDELVPISKFGKVQGGYAFKSKDLKDEATSNRIIKIKNLRNEINVDVCNSQFVDDEIIERLDKKFQLHSGDVAIAMTGAELGKTGFIYGKNKYFLNQRVGLIKGKSEITEMYLRILMLSSEFQILLNSKGYGSAQPNISTSDIENIEINNISEENLNTFYKMAKPIYEKIILTCEENLILGQLRDTLLPKLMNGEINLDNVEI